MSDGVNRLLILDAPEITHQAQVRAILPHLSTVGMSEFLETFTGYYNRLYTSEHGVAAERWLFDEILDVSLLRANLDLIRRSFAKRPQNVAFLLSSSRTDSP